MKAKRQRKIIELISEYNIETQEELASLLEREGFPVTQATISRDIRELNLTKIAVTGGGQKYIVPVSTTIDINNKYLRVINDGIVKIDIAENILVIKTVSGMAMAVAAAVDAMNIKEILGCIAGDDTIMCVIKTKENAPEVKNYLEKMIG
ncbi:arginine repressor [uncultured Eubacterium sp.]|uniref:arginine repressor n=1 Tax=uncultured Eubacterium sp. TaxID=165185 RepID=UPI002670F40F|nr:arginine repressor [uncultured Eubacterium sp.]